jgi:hypothetical protein
MMFGQCRQPEFDELCRIAPVVLSVFNTSPEIEEKIAPEICPKFPSIIGCLSGG